MSKTTVNYEANAMKFPRVKIVYWSVVSIMILAVHSFANLGNLVNRCDVNRDGVINIQDLILVSNHMGEKSDYSEMAEEVIHEVTFDNVLTLLPGEKYKLRFGDYQVTVDEFGERLVTHIYWGSVNSVGQLVKGFTSDDPKIRVTFFIYPHIYYKTLDGEPVFECEDIDGKILCDEIVIIVEKRGYGSKDTGGPKDNRFTYTDILYHTTVIGNLTHPDRKFRTASR